MKIYGVSIFSDDLAMDIRDDYNEYKYFIEDATKIKVLIKKKYKESLNFADQRPIFWYALALCMWKDGRLDEEVKNNALYYIDHPEEDENLQKLKKEADESNSLKDKKGYMALYEGRKEKLLELKEKLQSPTPKKRPLKMRKGVPSLFKVGDVVRVEVPEALFDKYKKKAFKMKPYILEKIKPLFSGDHFYMIKTMEKKRLISPIFKGEEENENRLLYQEGFSIFDWFGQEELSLEQIKELPIIDCPSFDTFYGTIQSSFNKRHAFWFCYYDLIYPDECCREEKYLKIDQFKTVFNDCELSERIKKIYRKGEEPRNDFFQSAILYFSTVKSDSIIIENQKLHAEIESVFSQFKKIDEIGKVEFNKRIYFGESKLNLEILNIIGENCSGPRSLNKKIYFATSEEKGLFNHTLHIYKCDYDGYNLEEIYTIEKYDNEPLVYYIDETNNVFYIKSYVGIFSPKEVFETYNFETNEYKNWGEDVNFNVYKQSISEYNKNANRVLEIKNKINDEMLSASEEGRTLLRYGHNDQLDICILNNRIFVSYHYRISIYDWLNVTFEYVEDAEALRYIRYDYLASNENIDYIYLY